MPDPVPHGTATPTPFANSGAAMMPTRPDVPSGRDHPLMASAADPAAAELRQVDAELPPWPDWPGCLAYPVEPRLGHAAPEAACGPSSPPSLPPPPPSTRYQEAATRQQRPSARAQQLGWDARSDHVHRATWSSRPRGFRIPCHPWRSRGIAQS